jgi:hypothetical protein
MVCDDNEDSPDYRARAEGQLSTKKTEKEKENIVVLI